jgi:hypothetical protein
MKILFLRLFSRISRFLIESSFKSCKEISLIIFVKTHHFSKETGRLEKILQFQMQFPQLDFFPVKVHDQGFQKWYVTSACRAVLSCESVLKTPKYTAKNLQSHSHFTLPPFFTII